MPSPDDDTPCCAANDAGFPCSCQPYNYRYDPDSPFADDARDNLEDDDDGEGH